MERGLEFYVMLAAVAVGALTWLYRKGSRVWRTVRKTRRSFQEICLNPKSTLDDERCRQLAIGAMYASQQGAWQNSLATGIFDTLPEIVGDWWGIDSTAEARAQLDYLCEKGFRYYWPTVLEAFRLDGRERQDELLQQRMTSQEDYDKVSSQLENLQETFDELLSCGVVASKKELNGCNVTGWDAGRIVFLARVCCEMGYLTEEEAWAYIGRADTLAHEACGWWRELVGLFVDSTAPNAATIVELAGEYIVWIILIPVASAMPFIMDGIMVGATETRVMRDSMFWATAAYFAIYYACYPLIGNNALWLAFTLYMFLRGVIQFFMTRRLKTIYDKIA